MALVSETDHTDRVRLTAERQTRRGGSGSCPTSPSVRSPGARSWRRSRWGSPGAATLGIGKRIGGKPAEVVATELQQRTAAQIFRVLGELKGGAMKLGQALSVFEAALPEEVAAPYRAALTRLQEAAPALPAATVHAVLAEQLGPGWRGALPRVRRPAGRRGQHRAGASRGLGGRPCGRGQDPVPGRRAARCCPTSTSSAGSPGSSRSSAPAWTSSRCSPSCAARVVEELDYRLEATWQRAFAEGFADDPDILVPHVVEFAERVLVTEWVDGIPLSSIIADGTPEQRDRAGLLLVRFAYSAPPRVGLLHADPHPGNFRLMPDGRLGVIDYGAVNRLPDGLHEPIGRLVRLALEGDGEAVAEGLRAEGFIRPRFEVDAEGVLDYVVPLLEPLRDEEFTLQSRLAAFAGDPAE